MQDVRPGDVLLFRGRTVYGQLIEAANFLRRPCASLNGHNWTHAGIVTERLQSGIVGVAEALTDGFTLSTYGVEELEDRYRDDLIKWGQLSRYDIVDSFETRDRLQRLVGEYYGRGYGWRDVWSIACPSVSLSTGAKALICSEAVARMLHEVSDGAVDIAAEFGVPFDRVEPYHLSASDAIAWVRDQ